MRFGIRQPAGPGEMFMPGAVDGTVGTSTNVDYLGKRTPATIIEARVVDDGRAIELMLEIADGALPDVQPGWKIAQP